MRNCKRLALTIAILLFVPCFAFGQVDYYVCVAPGTSTAIAAAYEKQYTSLATWNAAETGNLTTTNRIGSGGTKYYLHLIGDWTNVTPETAPLNFGAWATAGVTNMLCVEVPSQPRNGCTVSTRHENIWSDRKHRLIPTGGPGAGNLFGIYVGNQTVSIDGMQVKMRYKGLGSSMGVQRYATTHQGEFWLKNCIIQMDFPNPLDPTGPMQLYGVTLNAPAGITNWVSGNIILDARSGTSYAAGIQTNGGENYLGNNTIYGSYSGGIIGAGGNVYAFNNISFNTTAAFADYSGTLNGPYFLGNVGDNDESASVGKPDFNKSFIGGRNVSGTSDFRLSAMSGCTLISTGSLSGYGPQHPVLAGLTPFQFHSDVKGVPRSGVSCSVGADEYDLNLSARTDLKGKLRNRITFTGVSEYGLISDNVDMEPDRRDWIFGMRLTSKSTVYSALDGREFLLKANALDCYQINSNRIGIYYTDSSGGVPSMGANVTPTNSWYAGTGVSTFLYRHIGAAAGVSGVGTWFIDGVMKSQGNVHAGVYNTSADWYMSHSTYSLIGDVYEMFFAIGNDLSGVTGDLVMQWHNNPGSQLIANRASKIFHWNSDGATGFDEKKWFDSGVTNDALQRTILQGGGEKTTRHFTLYRSPSYALWNNPKVKVMPVENNSSRKPAKDKIKKQIDLYRFGKSPS